MVLSPFHIVLKETTFYDHEAAFLCLIGFATLSFIFSAAKHYYVFNILDDFKTQEQSF